MLAFMLLSNQSYYFFLIMATAYYIDFQAILEKILEKSPQNNYNNCRIWGGAKTNKYPYMRNPFGKNPRTLKVHRVVYICKITDINLPTQDSSGKKLEISHLCHNNECVNPDHVYLETHQTNMDRISCRVQGSCTHNHEPSCLF